MYERFTDRARKAMQLANQEAQRLNHEYIGTEHILLALVKEGAGIAAKVLKNLDIDIGKIRLEVEKNVQLGSGGEQVVMGRLPHTPRAKKVIDYAVEEARNLDHNYVGTEHLLLGLLREQEGVAAQALMNLGLKLAKVREEVLNLLGPTEYNKIPKALQPGAIETYPLSDLTPTDAPALPELLTDEQIERPGATETYPVSDRTPAAPESLTVYQIELIHGRIRQLNEQRETYEAAQDFVQAGQFRTEAEALNRLLELYFWFRGQR